ncbi:hypothetical protein QQZ08_000619 [Neonectria magnoliae]|uniref:Uncharacterized protein n=1 Tax=Neonectria magnoliae TaxID=2732573 RepID=A0ABR1IGQ2_9HYPO
MDGTMMIIHFNANLRPVVKDRVGMFHWIIDPVCSGFIIAYDMGGNHMLISNFDSTKHAADTWDQDLCRTTLKVAIGQDVPFNVLSYRPWLLSRKVVKQYRQQNVFLFRSSTQEREEIFSFFTTLGTAGIDDVEKARENLHKSIYDPAK